MGLYDHFDNTYRELDTQPKCLTCDQCANAYGNSHDNLVQNVDNIRSLR